MSARIKTKKQAKHYKANMGITHAAMNAKIDAAMDRMEIKRGGHRGMHHAKPRLKP